MAIPESTRRILGLARRNTRREDLPTDPESKQAIRLCELKEWACFVTRQGPPPSIPPAHMSRKRAGDLKHGDVLPSQNVAGSKVTGLRVTSHPGDMVQRRGKYITIESYGRELSTLHEDELVEVFDGPPPKIPEPETWDEWALMKAGDLALLEAEGEAETNGQRRASKRKTRNANDSRDAYIYRAMKAGETLAKIKFDLTTHHEWEPIHTEQGVSQAAGRYAKRRKKPWPLMS